VEVYTPIPEELLHRTPRAVRIAIRIAIRIATVGVVLAALTLVIARHGSGPAARRADLFGRATFERDRGYSFALGNKDNSRFGPGRLLIGGRTVAVPSRTPLYGGCAIFEAQLTAPCFVQVGLRPGTMTAKWVLGLYVTGRGPRSSLPTMRSQVRRVTSTSIEFKDGTVVPYRAMPIVTHCFNLSDGYTLHALSGNNVQIGVDPDSGELRTVECFALG
jgi:hypothetical protein